MIKVVSNKEQTATGPLPITLNSDGTPLDDYKLYGTSEGAGVETESGEPAGFKIPISLESGNLFTETGSGLVQVNIYGAKRFGKSLGKLPAGDYSITYTKTSSINIFITKRDNNNRYSTSESNPSTFSVSSTDAEIIIRTGYTSNDKTWAELGLTNIVVSQQSNYDLFIGDTKLGEEEYLDYESGKAYRCYRELTLKGDESNLYYFGVFGGVHTFYLELPDNEADVTTDTPHLSCNYYSTTYMAEPTVNKTCRYRRKIEGGKDIWVLGRIYLFDDDYSNLSDYKAHLAELYNNGVPLKISYLLKDAPVPTDPPVPFPTITAYKGENTLSCSEGLGDESQITYVGPVEETITKIMRTEDDGQGNVTEHVLYKEGS